MVSNSDKQTIAERAGQVLISASSSLSHIRSEVGILESSVNKEILSLNSERAALGLARSEIITIDPYETASALLASETEMHNIYVLTSRLSKLSLSEYIK